MESITISTVTPVYGGEKYLPDLLHALKVLREEWKTNYEGLKLKESIFVIDECRDNSDQILMAYQKNEPWVKVHYLSKNFGQHPATIAGVIQSTGEWVVTVDEDLQHHPKHIMDLLRRSVKEHSDICYVNSESKVHKSFIKDMFSKWFKYLVGRMIGDKNAKYYSSFRCIRGSVARAAAAVAGPDAYFDVALGWFTKRVVSENIELIDLRNLNAAEQSGYSLWSLIKHGKRMIMTAKLKLVRVIMFLGIVSFLFSIVFSAYVLFGSLYYGTDQFRIEGWPSTIVSIYFFGGLSCLFLGIIIEIISDLTMRANGKPTFFIVNRESDYRLVEILKKG
jgi:glycosyltransferase involved in cell wall biosynthesis